MRQTPASKLVTVGPREDTSRYQTSKFAEVGGGSARKAANLVQVMFRWLRCANHSKDPAALPKAEQQGRQVVALRRLLAAYSADVKKAMRML